MTNIAAAAKKNQLLAMATFEPFNIIYVLGT